MGYLSKTTIEVDAILTDKGRSLLAKGGTNFKITKFALADDEIDYRLYNPNHTLGSDYYGEEIEAIPILEASPSEKFSMRYKLFTQQATGGINFVISDVASSYTLTQNTRFDIAPNIPGYDLNQVGRFFTIHCAVPFPYINDSRDLNKIFEFGVNRTDASYVLPNGYYVDQYNNNLIGLYNNTQVPEADTWADSLLNYASNDPNGEFGKLYAYSFFIKRNNNPITSAPAINTLITQNGFYDMYWWVTHDLTQAVVANFQIKITS